MKKLGPKIQTWLIGRFLHGYMLRSFIKEMRVNNYQGYLYTVTSTPDKTGRKSFFTLHVHFTEIGEIRADGSILKLDYADSGQPQTAERAQSAEENMKGNAR